MNNTTFPIPICFLQTQHRDDETQKDRKPRSSTLPRLPNLLRRHSLKNSPVKERETKARTHSLNSETDDYDLVSKPKSSCFL